MTSVTIIHVGDFKEKFLQDAFSEYTKRISGMAKVEDILIKEENVTDTADALVERALEKEGREILTRLDERSFKIALCVEGKMLSSEELATLFSRCQNEGKSHVTFIIGSSHGLSDKVKRACDLKLSFSKMTFPHQLMRVILAEQIYRGMTILAGKKYHK